MISVFFLGGGGEEGTEKTQKPFQRHIKRRSRMEGQCGAGLVGSEIRGGDGPHEPYPGDFPHPKLGRFGPQNA